MKAMNWPCMCVNSPQWRSLSGPGWVYWLWMECGACYGQEPWYTPVTRKRETYGILCILPVHKQIQKWAEDAANMPGKTWQSEIGHKPLGPEGFCWSQLPPDEFGGQHSMYQPPSHSLQGRWGRTCRASFLFSEGWSGIQHGCEMSGRWPMSVLMFWEWDNGDVTVNKSVCEDSKKGTTVAQIFLMCYERAYLSGNMTRVMSYSIMRHSHYQLI